MKNGFSWVGLPAIRRYLHALVSGDVTCDWLTYVELCHLPPAPDRALVLGCGPSGWLELALASRHRFRSIVACDLTGDWVRSAQARAREAGITNIDHRVLDPESDSLDGPYDAVFLNGFLHHVVDLEGMYLRIETSLKNNGRVIFNEYVGPNRFQYPEARLALVDRYFRLLPDGFRVSSDNGSLLWSCERVDRVALERDDPRRAVRSEEVLPLARRFFETEKEYPYGGGLLNPLLSGIASNFQSDEGERYLETFCGAERRLASSGDLESDFVIFVGSRRMRSTDLNDSFLSLVADCP